MLCGIDGLRNNDDVELIDVEFMSIRGPRAKTRGMDRNPAYRWLWKYYQCYLCQQSARGYSCRVAGWLVLYIQG